MIEDTNKRISLPYSSWKEGLAARLNLSSFKAGYPDSTVSLESQFSSYLSATTIIPYIQFPCDA